MMRLSDALKFSRTRTAMHIAEDDVTVIATDFNVTLVLPDVIGQSPGLGSIHNTYVSTWLSLNPIARRTLLRSEHWEPIDPKPAMIIIAEATSDWSIEDTAVENWQDGEDDGAE